MTDQAAPVKRRPPAAGMGRKKGVPNTITRDVKEMVLVALHHAGGAEYLCMQAYDNPKAFLTLVGRVLPMQVVGDGGGPVQLVLVGSDVHG